MSKSKINFLEPDTMLLLYARGAFPMADEFGIIDWYLPEVRTIIPLDNFNFPRSLKKFITAIILSINLILQF
jgi:leucyl/phenylalanyl-tRNA--protein transferase